MNWTTESQYISKRKNLTVFVCQALLRESLSVWNVSACISSDCPMIDFPSVAEFPPKMKFISLYEYLYIYYYQNS